MEKTLPGTGRYLRVLIFLVGLAVTGISTCPADEIPREPGQMSRLEIAENTRDIDAIGALFAEDAVIHVPDNMPFVGREVIISLFEFIWRRPERKTTLYRVEGIERTGGLHVEHGTSITRDQQGKEQTFPFRAVFDEGSNDTTLVIRKLTFGDTEPALLALPAPTGSLGVGRAVHYRDRTDTPDGRPLAFEVWYPAVTGEGEKAVHHVPAVTRASANFLGLPPFLFSYSATVSSNSVINASPKRGQVFPVVLYNHGYGGFTSVYQTVFEELASHGYVVVSVGHVQESALLIVDYATVKSSQPGNDVYASRAHELEGPKINSLQATILNSDDPVELDEAYRALVQQSPLHNESTGLWASDTRRVIARLYELNASDPLLQGILDLDAIGVMGHSVGGATAGQLAYDTPAVSAGINIDGFQFGSLVENRLAVPFLFISSNETGDSYLRAFNFMLDSKVVAYQAVLKGFSHGSFSDLTFFQTGADSGVDGKESIRLQRALIRTFFDRHLKNADTELSTLADEYDGVSITSYVK